MAFDYLVDRMQSDSAASPVPDVTWLQLLQDIEGEDAFTVGYGAFEANRRDFAERAWRKAAAAGHHGAEYNLGSLLQEQRRTEEAEQWFHKAADAGHHGAETNLGILLAQQDRTEEAEEWFRKAAVGERGAEVTVRTQEALRDLQE